MEFLEVMEIMLIIGQYIRFKFIYIYIYIYMCVCVCVCVLVLRTLDKKVKQLKKLKGNIRQTEISDITIN